MSAPLVHVVDDDADMRGALERLLRAEGYEVRSYASADAFQLARPASGCVVLDLHMPGMNGLQLQASMSLPVVFLSGRGDVPSTARAMKAGAIDFLTKPVEPAALLEAVEAALALGRTQQARQDVQACYEKLTARERAVFEQVVAGKANKVIARSLGITERTVKMHRGQMMEKMGVPSVADLVRAASKIKR